MPRDGLSKAPPNTLANTIKPSAIEFTSFLLGDTEAYE